VPRLASRKVVRQVNGGRAMRHASRCRSVVNICGFMSVCFCAGTLWGACGYWCVHTTCINYDSLPNSKGPCYSADENVCQIAGCNLGVSHPDVCTTGGCGGSSGKTNTWECEVCNPECVLLDPSHAGACAKCKELGDTDIDACDPFS
jgi:hypothetical protein